MLNTNWGTLIILDACRYDVFEQVAQELQLAGQLRRVDTGVCSTAAWYDRYWKGTPGATPIVAVIANAWGLRKLRSINSRLVSWPAGADCTKVDPDRTMEYYRRYGLGKRCVVHFVPPHLPWLGRQGKALAERLGIADLEIGGINWEDAAVFKPFAKQRQQRIEAYGREGHWAEIREVYTENVRLIVAKVREWLPEFRPPVVLTADHGNCIGEGGKDGTGGYGHAHPGVAQDVQRLVPWFEVDADVDVLR
jgi:hypothetical protein